MSESGSEAASLEAPSVDAGDLRALDSESGDVAFGGYRLRRCLSRGILGSVYLGHDPERGRDVAIELVHAWPAGEPSTEEPPILRQVRATAKLSHPNIAQIHEAGVFTTGGGDGEARRGVFVVMEYVEGQSLVEWLADGARQWPEILAVFLAAGQGLVAGHSQGIIHRNFSPANVIVDFDGSVRVVNFGLTWAIEQTLQGSAPEGVVEGDAARSALAQAGLFRFGERLLVGSPAYMAPEQLEGRPVNPRTDQYALATAIFEAVYGHHPTPGASLSKFASSSLAGVSREPDGAEVPRWLGKALMRARSRDPNSRYLSMNAFVQTLIRRLNEAARQRSARLAESAIARQPEAEVDYRSHIQWLEPGIILYEEPKRPTLLSTHVMREELTRLTKGLRGYAMFVDISKSVMPGPEVRAKIRDMFRDDNLLFMVLHHHDDDPMRTFAALLILDTIPEDIYMIMHSRTDAIERLRAVLADAGIEGDALGGAR